MKKTSVHLHPGEYFASSGRVGIISTILGSCVSACIFDPVCNVFGMNHFLLSSKRYSRDLPYYETDAGRYGIQAMELLLNRMLSLGARRQNLKAKAFGGASILPSLSRPGNYLCVGEVNVRFIREFLKLEDIPLVSEDLGGNLGRIVRFHGNDFSVYVKKIQSSLRSKEISTQEGKYWKKQITQQDVKKPDISIWE
jgi:chemotaxis protein CheD